MSEQANTEKLNSDLRAAENELDTLRQKTKDVDFDSASPEGQQTLDAMMAKQTEVNDLRRQAQVAGETEKEREQWNGEFNAQIAKMFERNPEWASLKNDNAWISGTFNKARDEIIAEKYKKGVRIGEISEWISAVEARIKKNSGEDDDKDGGEKEGDKKKPAPKGEDNIDPDKIGKPAPQMKGGEMSQSEKDAAKLHVSDDMRETLSNNSNGIRPPEDLGDTEHDLLRGFDGMIRLAVSEPRIHEGGAVKPGVPDSFGIRQ